MQRGRSGVHWLRGHGRRTRRGHVSDVAPPLDTTDVVCLLALGALALQVLCASPFDADDPAHLAFAVFAHGQSALAQAVAVSTRGARSFTLLYWSWPASSSLIANARS